MGKTIADLTQIRKEVHERNELYKIAKRFENIITHYGCGTMELNNPDKVFFANGFSNEILSLFAHTKEVLDKCRR
ncbi:MAG: hypothetical protein WC554_16525 [Clostridia bacterium]